VQLGNPMRAFLCVGIAYFLVAVLIPAIYLGVQGQLSGFNAQGTITATWAGALGALGAAFIIFSFKFGASPLYVMPLVFGGAPIVNTLYTMATHPPKSAINPMFWVGIATAVAGAGMVLYYKPSS
jgi:hypothetical protein